MKAYTDIEQSKRLTEILPLETADMHCWKRTWKENDYAICVGHSKEWQEGFESKGIEYVPCWSLAALLNVINTIKGWYPGIDAQIDENMWQICMFSYETGSDLSTAAVKEELVDTCYEVILKLKEKGLL